MLLPHSQKKPIHFKIPVWVFGMFFLMIMTLVGGVLFFAGSTPVSYTHLDVYKRQLQGLKGTLGHGNLQLRL